MSQAPAHQDTASAARGGPGRSAADGAPAPAPRPHDNELLQAERLQRFLVDADARPPPGLAEPRSVAQAEARMATILAELQKKLDG